jgi:hypothetical protein
MSLSQFHAHATLAVDPAHARERPDAGPSRIEVGGPLVLDSASDYEMPITVKFLIIQSPKDDHDLRHARRVRGCVEADRSGQWQACVDFPEGQLMSGEARGIAVAVMEKKDQFGFETLTWCDHIELVVKSPASQDAVAAA